MTLNEFAKTVLPGPIYRNLFLLRHLQKLATRDGAYLVETGYIQSIKSFEPINKQGEPIPWMNYSFLDFLEPRLNKSMNVFEYGSGYSTLYLSEKVGSVVSVEFDKSWFNKMKHDLADLSHCSIMFRPGHQEYIEAINEYGDERFDLIIVDGRDRKECVKHILPYLNNDGVVLLDDSWQEKFDETFEFFKEEGFRELSFTGLKPGGMIVEKTTVFYRQNNVLGI
jgi:protein-L-isoaspartate O-methyltransferase